MNQLYNYSELWLQNICNSTGLETKYSEILNLYNQVCISVLLYNQFHR